MVKRVIKICDFCGEAILGNKDFNARVIIGKLAIRRDVCKKCIKKIDVNKTIDFSAKPKEKEIKQHKVEQPKVEQPKVEEPKGEEPKAEEPKVGELEAEEITQFHRPSI